MTRALVADDDQDIRDLVALVLSDEGFEVVVQPDGPSALRVFRDNPVDVVVLDLMMPGMSGLDVCRVLRRDPAGAYVPVVLLTSAARQIDARVAIAGADAAVAKPFAPSELADRVRAVLVEAAA